MKPDYVRIHKLEYELGFREDPPPGRPNLTLVNFILKELYTPEVMRRSLENQYLINSSTR